MERCARLYDAYCKYLLSYDTQSVEEKQRLQQQVQADRNRKRATMEQDCVVKVSFCTPR